MSEANSSTIPDPRDMKPIVGTGMARFLNQYNPEHDKPYERQDNNRGQYIDQELAKLLEEERQALQAKQHNKRKDWMKNYMDECVKFKSITRQNPSGSKK
jgi:hypothetical protein